MAKINILENKNNHWQLELPSEIHKPLHHPENIFNYQQEQCFEKLEDFFNVHIRRYSLMYDDKSLSLFQLKNNYET